MHRDQNQIEACRSMRLEVLTGEDPEVWLERDGLEEYLGQTMNEILAYLDASYMMDVDPLEYLRKYLPEFTWEFHQEDWFGDKAHPIIAEADYIFPVFGGSDLVTARQIGRNNPRCLMHWPRKGAPDLMEELRASVPALKFVLKDSEDRIGTFIK